MLGIISVISLVVGAFAAGGGAFDWEFLFSDGHREHEWVRNLGRAGARGMVVLLGGVLVVVGFVGQVVDNAAKPVVVTANTQDTADTPYQPPSPTAGSGSPTAETSQTQAHRPTPGNGPTASAQGAYPPAATNNRPPAGKNQTITIWNPQLEFSEEEAMIRLQYQFEPKYEPIAGAEYFWQIDVPAKPTEVEYDSLQSEGQLEHILRLPQPAKTLSEAWSMRLMVKSDGKLAQASNRLDIAGGQVRSTPLEVSR